MEILLIITISLFYLSLISHIILCNSSKRYLNWINKDNEGSFTGIIHTDNYNWLNASSLLMPFDESIKGFLSVADSLEHLYQWFSKKEILILQERGYSIEEWVADNYKFYEPYKHNIICEKTSILNNKLKIYEPTIIG